MNTQCTLWQPSNEALELYENSLERLFNDNDDDDDEGKHKLANDKHLIEYFGPSYCSIR